MRVWECVCKKKEQKNRDGREESARVSCEAKKLRKDKNIICFTFEETAWKMSQRIQNVKVTWKLKREPIWELVGLNV